MPNTFRMRPFFICLFSILIAVLIPAASADTAIKSPPARLMITRSIDPAKLITLYGNTRSEATEQNDRGKVPDQFLMDHMLLQLRRSPEREQALETLIAGQQNAASPYFHQWLTPTEFGRLYGPSRRDIQTVSEWLRSSGFTVNAVYPSGMLIDFSGTAGQVLAAFHTEIHELSVDGKNHIANMTNPRIPEALAPVITGVVSLHDFHPHAMRRPRAQYTVSSNGYTFYPLVPADLATIYDLNPAFTAGYTGQGQTVAVIEDSDMYSASDWTDFRTELGLSTYSFGKLNFLNPEAQGGPVNCSDPGPNGDDVEATLDVEWAGAAAPNATIVLAACDNTSTTSGLQIATQNVVNMSSRPQIVSISYGECEAAAGESANAAFNSAFQQAVSQGMSIFVAAGDSGAATCDSGYDAATHGVSVSASAASPYAVAVGGTDFADMSQGTIDTYWSATNSDTYGSALSYIPEIPWNDSCAGSILANYLHYSVGYGAAGLCGSDDAQAYGLFDIGAGSGGPSGCATGNPTISLVVSGTCQGFAKPAWQGGVTGIPNDGVRDVPDVSLFAASGVWGHYYVTCFTDIGNGGTLSCAGPPINWFGAGGTSYAAPILAGIQALVNQKMGGSQGDPNSVYYKLAASSVASSVFHSITTGDIVVNCSGDIQCYGAAFVGRGRSTPATFFNGNGALSTTSNSYNPAFTASAGWNFATGLGSVDAYNLIMNWTAGQ